MAARSSRFYAQVPIDLQMAVGLANLTRYKAVIVAELLVAHYGLVEHRSLGINNTDYGRALGVDVRQIRRDRKWLLQSRLIVELHEDAFALNPDWRSWMDCDTQMPVIDAKSRTKIAAVVARFSPEDRQKKTPPARTIESVHPDNPVLEALAHVGQDCPRSASPCRTIESPSVPESLGVDADAKPLAQSDLPAPSRAGAGGRNLEFESREKREDDYYPARGVQEDLIQAARDRLIARAHEHVHFLEDGFDSTFCQLDRSIRRWLGKGVAEDVIAQAFAQTSARHVKPHGFARYAADCVRSGHERYLADLAADAAIPSAARQDTPGATDVPTIHPIPARPVAGHQRPSRAEHRASEAAKTREYYRNRNRHGGQDGRERVE